ncbi:TolC family protein [Synechococcus sp. MIT S1220]|uniref:TolC family protein n=1 Tax=Synechococcus sp. MIT S1220 TaxID=3082549 RepID=UPI0039AF29CF
MRRFTAASCLVAGLLVTGGSSAFAQAPEQETPEQDNATYRHDQEILPNAIYLKGPRPKADPSALPPAATTLPDDVKDLKAPPSLALPNQSEQVRIRELRPLTLDQALEVVEVNSPSLKAAASRVDQAKSRLRAAISAWYPTVSLQANGFPQYFKSYRYRNPEFTRRTIPAQTGPFGQVTPERTIDGQNEFYARQWAVNFGAAVNWNIIDPARVPQIALARDNFERTRDAYLIALRDLRLQASSGYFALQSADEGVRVGQASVKASLLSLRDARARFNAGVNTKLDVLEAETQLAEDRKILTDYLARQDLARRQLAFLLDLPQDVTPTAATPPQPLGLWEPSLQESIIAAYNYREELDQLILDISINNSRANASLAAIQPVLTFVNNWTTSRTDGQSGRGSWGAVDMDDYQWDVSNATSLQLRWNLYDGGRARADYRQSKQAAEESAFNFASERDSIRLEVEQSFFELRKSIQNIQTTSSRVLTSRESLRLSLLRVQAGVSTQREVINNQQDLTRAELAYTDAIRTYNTSLAELRRRTGLDALLPCGTPNRPATKAESEISDIPIEPTSIPSACPAVISAADNVDGDTLPVQPLW